MESDLFDASCTIESLRRLVTESTEVLWHVLHVMFERYYSFSLKHPFHMQWSQNYSYIHSETYGTWALNRMETCTNQTFVSPMQFEPVNWSNWKTKIERLCSTFLIMALLFRKVFWFLVFSIGQMSLCFHPILVGRHSFWLVCLYVFLSQFVRTTTLNLLNQNLRNL